MKKQLVSFVLVLVMIFGMIPMTASADTNEIGMRLLGEDEAYTEMITSQSMVDMIKDMEGFREEPYWDVNQWSVGYGSGCGTDKSEKPDILLTEEEAEALLMEDLAEKYGKIVNDYCASIGRQPSQQQFDALVDFTYNLGGSWTDGCWLTRWLEEPTTEMDFVNAIGRWGRVSSKANYVTCARRVREAIVFLHGEYYLAYGDQDFETELDVVSNHSLPYYKVVIFQANGGLFEDLEDEIRYYRVGEPYGSFQIPVRDGYLLTGWQAISENNVDVDAYYITPEAVVEKNLKIVALWREIPEETEPEETEPEKTEPEETEPEETEPEETEPEETEPEETEPEETEPEETEPEETEPEETEPEETEPEETEPEETEPEETEPEETEPEETEPEETEPEETEPEETEPEETEPEETEPEETEPEETEPEETEPTEPSGPDMDVDVELPFTDVSESAWYRDAVEFVYQNGYMNGMSETKFMPQYTVTRGMMVTVLYRMAGSPEVSEEDAEFFRDTQGQYYTDPVGWAKANGIVNGMTATRFEPNRNLTRQDAMTIFYRYCVEYLGLDGSCTRELGNFIDSNRVADYAHNPISWAVDNGIMSGAPGNGGMMLNPRNNLTRAEAAKLLQSLVMWVYEAM